MNQKSLIRIEFKEGKRKREKMEKTKSAPNETLHSRFD